jgi:tape measure domain-containing protein
MVREVLQVDIVSTGGRVVKRNIDDIGAAADRLTHGIYLLRRAMFTLGAGGIVAAFTGMLDTLTAYENRIRLTATSTANMEGVQQALFEVAKRSRTEFSAVADVYTRTALSARRLGISQQEVIDITESLSKAAILSGANSREANAALVQLSQGLAANRLGGDELRSILEQLPYVADVIADYMTKTGQFGQVSRAELKKLGSEGAITADIITKAFAAAKGKIDLEFSQTQSTIGQSVTNLVTAFLKWLDKMDDAYQLSKRIADGINYLADNFDYFMSVVKTATAALILFYAAPKIATLISTISSLAQFSMAVSSGRMVLLGSVQADYQKAASLMTLRNAELMAAQASLANQRIRVANLTSSAAELRNSIIQNQYTVANGRARNVLTGRFVSQAAAEKILARDTLALVVAEKSLVTQNERLAASQIAVQAANGRAVAASTAAASAQAAANTRWARLAQMFPLTAIGLEKVRSIFALLFGIMRRNPIASLITAFVTLAAAVFGFGDKITPVANKLVTLRDIAQVVVTNILEFFRPVTDFITNAFTKAFSFVMDVLNLFGTAFTVGIETIMLGFLTIIQNTWGLVVGIFMGAKALVVAAWNNFPAAFEMIFVNAVNLAIAAIQFLIDTTSAPLKALLMGLDYISGKNMAGQFFNITQLPTATLSAEAQAAGTAVATAFADGFNEGRAQVDNAIISTVTSISSGVAGVTNSIIADATKLAQDRAADALLIAKAQALTGIAGAGGAGTGTPPGTGGGAGAAAADLRSFLAEMQKQIDLNFVIGNQAAAMQAIESAEEKLKRRLTDAERALVAAKAANLEISKEVQTYLEKFIKPASDVANKQAALNQVFANGTITLKQYNDELRNLAVLATEGNNTFFGGLTNGFARVSAEANNFGQNVSDWVVQSFASATDAVAEFANTGIFDMRAFFNDIFTNLLKLATNQLFSQLLGTLFGAPGGATSFLSGLLPGFASGGSIMPNGSGTTDSQLVMFNKRPDERVDILTPAQQSAQRNAMAGANGGTVVNANSKIVNVLDPALVGDYLGTSDGETLVMNIISRNRTKVRNMTK